MRRHLKLLTLFAACALYTTARADSPLPPGCTLNETATISINLNGIEHDAGVVKSILDKKLDDIKSVAKASGVTKFDMQSSNYSINANNNGGYGGEPSYQYNGSFSFATAPADQAVALMVTLSKKGYQPSVSVNSYRNGTCNQ